MKKLLTGYGLIVILGVSELFAQHIPPCQGYRHSTSICFGYATARAFGRGWDNPVCPARNLYFSQAEGIPEEYFDWHAGSSLSGIKAGDIIKFTSPHAAYVRSTSGGISVDQVPYQGGPEQRDVSLDTLGSYGAPLGYYRKKPLWSVKVQNQLGTSPSQVKVGGVSYPSPKTFSNVHWESSYNIDAIMDGQIYEGYKRFYDRWTKNGVNMFKPKATTVVITDYSYSDTIRYTAYFLKEFNVTFQNSFIGVGNKGVTKVNGQQYTLPVSSFKVKERDSITGQALNQVYNGIQYTFTQWHDGNTSAQRTFTPNYHATYTASFTGKPVRVTIVSSSGPVGTNITIVWQEHINPNVSKYQVWRKVKHSQTGVWDGPTLLSTLNRGTTTYVDYEYIYTNGYTDDLLQYDIRAYYSVENSYADPYWFAAYGEQLYKPVAENPTNGPLVPTEYAIGNHPNPFNAETNIQFQLVEEGRVMLEVYNLRGQQMHQLVEGIFRSGYYYVRWDGKDKTGQLVASGVYLARLVIQPNRGEPRMLTHRMLMLK
jgi:hypothetical protein